MYLISARLAKALVKEDTEFGGMNMIFAGDFAQLAPPIASGKMVLALRLP